MEIFNFGSLTLEKSQMFSMQSYWPFISLTEKPQSCIYFLICIANVIKLILLGVNVLRICGFKACREKLAALLKFSVQTCN